MTLAAHKRRLEQVLHVHPEKYQNPERYGRRSSRFATPVGITRSASVECALIVRDPIPKASQDCAFANKER
ncbi:hypothetical protein TELCIR_14319 [Teladorsagia circumcincta]|uniref:Uncharacterized protein n=1 Tax=Teladorsagia circumcincta TaxID=45464 RepID=A0A2G9U1I9_TELCI|nr:hypothetical protein TELCIR_14319 [Teladorsagia circumcincta]